MVDRRQQPTGDGRSARVDGPHASASRPHILGEPSANGAPAAAPAGTEVVIVIEKAAEGSVQVTDPGDKDSHSYTKNTWTVSLYPVVVDGTGLVREPGSEPFATVSGIEVGAVDAPGAEKPSAAAVRSAKEYAVQHKWKVVATIDR